MAFASLFTLPDDITAVLDDVALMTKAAAKKTADVVGDDLASNANRVTGVSAERELPIVWPVAKGSFADKPVLVPAALLLSTFLPQLITPLLTAGGIYLCFEGVEKLPHKFLHRHDVHNDGGETTVDEQDKIKGAIRTDFILSAEIIIALCVVEQYSLITRSLVMAAIGMTVLVYGIVAVIVKLDDLGMLLMRRPQAFSRSSGQMLTTFMPWFMRGLSVIGTLAMFLAGGGLVAHNLGFLHDFLHAQQWDAGWAEYFANLVVGLLSGSIACAPRLAADESFRQALIPFSNTDAV
nr:DUF808 domain-containing protein [Neisseria bergeri]